MPHARVGLLAPAPELAPFLDALVARLDLLGFREGENLTLDRRVAPRLGEPLAAAVAALVEGGPDVIVAATAAALGPAIDATARIPTV